MIKHTEDHHQVLWNNRNVLSPKERRKWDAVFTILIFLFVLIASILFNFLSKSDPLIASSLN
jgi:hypothetical protein